MAIKVRLTFFAYDNGVEIKHTSGASIVNTIDEAEQKAKDLAMSEFPDAENLNIVFNQKFLTYGGWIIVGTSQTDENMAFLLVMNRLP